MAAARAAFAEEFSDERSPSSEFAAWVGVPGGAALDVAVPDGSISVSYTHLTLPTKA